MRQNALSQVFRYGLLVITALVILLPFAFMVSTSFKSHSEIYEVPFRWIPRRPTLGSYEKALEQANLLRGLFNTLSIAIPSTLGGLLTASFAGFAFAKLRFPGRDQLFALLMSTMMLPAIVTLIPQFLGFARIGWVDTYWPLIVPGAMGTALATFMMRQYFKTIPDEVIEAAALDGANPLQTFAMIILPLAKPALVTLGVFGLKGAWNDYFGPLIYIASPEKMTIQQMIAGTQNAYGGEPGVLMAGATLAMLPLVVLFLFAQRVFVEGISTTGLKG
ncbi:MAG TPA: carbohydrate ABC transporter permease [Labilithrix sp.]|nr:carbohydrate ABC transporter permease [Labilithrix sp.]